MKTRLFTLLCVLAIGSLSVTPARANNDYNHDMFTVVADTVIVRPGCFAATIIGSAFFVVTLPIAAASKSVKKTAHTLVLTPGKFTFTRPLGEFRNMDEDPK
ncbi:conserved exported hypothetical protein [Verrucomicrobia bacterium]|nr:conserved exported hypothetical protein [Verrucomicrobiota bacterium]